MCGLIRILNAEDVKKIQSCLNVYNNLKQPETTRIYYLGMAKGLADGTNIQIVCSITDNNNKTIIKDIFKSKYIKDMPF